MKGCWVLPLLAGLGAVSPLGTAQDAGAVSAIPDAPSRAPQSPCTCADGQCGCCTGYVLQQFNINVPQKACVNLTYDPDEFALNMAVYANDRLLYQNSVSGKNPRPMCVPLPRVPNVRFCARFYNVYFTGPNIHTCLDTEVKWRGIVLLQAKLDCMRLGAGGFAVLKPEDGGGLPQGPIGGGGGEYDEYEDPADDDADDNDDDDDDDDDEIRVADWLDV